MDDDAAVIPAQHRDFLAEGVMGLVKGTLSLFLLFFDSLFSYYIQARKAKPNVFVQS